MLINEVNLYLDKRGRISFNFEIDNQPIWNAADLTSIAKIRITKNGGFIIVNNKSDVSNQDVIREFQRRNAIHIGDSWSLNLDISNTTLLSFFKDLISIPSVVVDSIIIVKMTNSMKKVILSYVKIAAISMRLFKIKLLNLIDVRILLL